MHHLQGMCETMARLVCHTSQLKDYDVRLNEGSYLQAVCPNCDLGIRETVKHICFYCLFSYPSITLILSETSTHINTT